MEILFMVFMVIVSIMALFAVMVVFRDIVKEILEARREKENASRCIAHEAERIIDEVSAKEPATVSAAVDVGTPAVIVEPVEEAIEEASSEIVEKSAESENNEMGEEIAEVAVEEAFAEDAEGTISFSMGQQQTLEEKYLALPSEQRGWYDEIIKYAAAVEGSKRMKTVRHEEYKVGNNRIVRLLIKRGIIHCEFILHNSDFKNYVNENKIAIRQSATTMLVESAATVDAVKNSIDIVVSAINEEKEYKKQLARERRRAARRANNENSAKEEQSDG